MHRVWHAPGGACVTSCVRHEVWRAGRHGPPPNIAFFHTPLPLVPHRTNKTTPAAGAGLLQLDPCSPKPEARELQRPTHTLPHARLHLHQRL